MATRSVSKKIALPTKRQFTQIGGVMLVVLLGYEFVVSPWIAKQRAAAAADTTTT